MHIRCSNVLEVLQSLRIKEKSPRSDYAVTPEFVFAYTDKITFSI